MKAETGDFFQFRFETEANPPHRLAGMRVESVEPQAAESKAPAEPPKTSDAEAAVATDEFLRDLSSRDEFSGVVLLAKNDAPFLEKAYGIADREFSVPVNIETKFNLGSINKIFTKTAVAQLAAAGKLSLSDTIRKHLPRYGALCRPRDHPAASRLLLRDGGLLRREVRGHSQRETAEPGGLPSSLRKRSLEVLSETMSSIRLQWPARILTSLTRSSPTAPSPTHPPAAERAARKIRGLLPRS